MEEEPDQITSTMANGPFNYRCDGSFPVGPVLAAAGVSRAPQPFALGEGQRSKATLLLLATMPAILRATNATNTKGFPRGYLSCWKEDFEVREAAIDWEDDEFVEFGATTVGSVCFIECGERFEEMSFYRILDMAQPMTALDDDVQELIFDTASPLPVVDIPQVEWTPVLDFLTGPPNTSVVSSVPHSSRPIILNRILDSTSSDGAIEEDIVAPVRKRKPTGEPVEQDRHAVKKPKVAGEGTVTTNTEMIAVDEKRNVGAVPKKRNESLQSDEAVWQSTKHGKTVAGRKRTVKAKVAAGSGGAPSSGRMSGAPKLKTEAQTADNTLQGAVAKGEGAEVLEGK
ncbi:hypothetical protein M422DRAFT_274254 [Sphaerobolus stellatus SS14]|uniref:Uncharacterized protein n=1 Tax=Sphaerobolus stellatus (strain SS14) TaxID=990650 RepID=A0A0C9UHI5_SPHS4|nr:hypothetical protein M422DRAFT_274254 [Sphaerobolus stellatus SS14]